MVFQFVWQVQPTNKWSREKFSEVFFLLQFLLVPDFPIQIKANKNGLFLILLKFFFSFFVLKPTEGNSILRQKLNLPWNMRLLPKMTKAKTGKCMVCDGNFSIFSSNLGQEFIKKLFHTSCVKRWLLLKKIVETKVRNESTRLWYKIKLRDTGTGRRWKMKRNYGSNVRN